MNSENKILNDWIRLQNSRFTDGTLYEIKGVDRPTECVNSCLNYKGCVSINILRNTKRCRLNSNTLGSGKRQFSNTTDTYILKEGLG